jgi:hypothetical protein
MKYKDFQESDLIICLDEIDNNGLNVWDSKQYNDKIFYSINEDLGTKYKILAVLAAYFIDIAQYIFKNGRFKWPAITRYPKIIVITIKMIFTVIKITKKENTPTK